MLNFYLLLACTLTSAIAAFFVKKFKIKYFISILFISLLILSAGVLLILKNSSEMNKATLHKKWPVAEGVVISAKVEGRRAYHPNIIYQYTVNGKIYRGRSILNMPGFGGRTNRFETSENMAKEFPKGSKIAVHYNPENPAESLLKVNPSSKMFLQLGFGMFLYAIGFFLAGILIKNKIAARMQRQAG